MAENNGTPIIPPEILKKGYAGQLGAKQAQFQEAINRGIIPAKDSFFGEIAEMVKEYSNVAVKGASNLITGDNRRENKNIKEIPSNLRNAFTSDGQVGMKLALGRDDLRKVDIFRDMFGKVPARLDKFGNAIVSLDGSFANRFKIEPGDYYLNEPGASSQDFDDVMTTALSEIFFARLGSKIGGKYFGTAGKIIGGGAGAGGGAVAQDLVAGVAGSERGVDPISALVATTFGIAGETVSQLAVPFLKKFFTSNEFIKDGVLTSPGKKALRTVGIDPNDVTPEFITKFENFSQTAISPQEAARLAAGESLPQPVGLSQGDITRKESIQSIENEILARNDTPGNIMSDFRVKQQNQLTENIPLIQQKIAPTTVSAVDPVDAAVDVFSELNKKSKVAQRKVDRLYTVARGRGKNAFLDNANLNEQIDIISKNIVENYNPLNTPKAFNLLNDLKKVVNLKKVSVNDLENWRKRARNSLGSDSSENSAIKATISQYDSFVDNLMDDLVTSGDADKFKFWFRARKANKEFREKFSDDKIIAKILDKDNPLEPSEAFNLLFTPNAAGKKGVTRTVLKLKETLGEEGFNKLKQGAFLRITEQAQKVASGEQGVKAFSGAGFKTALVNLQRRTPELYNALFTKSDTALLNQFANVAELATTSVPGGKNVSGTAAVVTRKMQQVFGPNLAILVDRLLAPITSQYRTGQAKILTSGGIDQRSLPSGYLSGGFATAGQSELGDSRRVTVNPNQR
jgi:hypothetical protein